MVRRSISMASPIETRRIIEQHGLRALAIAAAVALSETSAWNAAADEQVYRTFLV